MDKNKKIKINLSALPGRALVFIVLIWVIITILTINAFTTNQFIEQRFNKNVITQNTVFDYKTKELPNGIIGSEGIIFPKTQNLIDVYIKTAITSIKPVSVSGNYSILLKLIAEGLWQRTETLVNKQYFYKEGDTIELINEKVSIDLEKIFNDIEIISNEIIGAGPSKFLLSIVPVVEGDITYENNKINLENNLETNMTFELSQSQVTFTGEKEYSKEVPIEEVEILERKIDLFGLMIPILVYRYVLLFIFLICSGFVLMTLLSKRQIRIEQMTEADEIEKKYKNRLVPIQQPIDYENKTYIPLYSMKSLVRISDEQDRGIFKYRCDIKEKIFYYVIEGDYIYTYTIDINNKEKEKNM